MPKPAHDEKHHFTSHRNPSPPLCAQHANYAHARTTIPQSLTNNTSCMSKLSRITLASHEQTKGMQCTAGKHGMQGKEQNGSRRRLQKLESLATCVCFCCCSATEGRTRVCLSLSANTWISSASWMYRSPDEQNLGWMIKSQKTIVKVTYL